MTEQDARIPTPDDFYTDAQRKLQAANGHDKLSQAVVQAIVRDDPEDYHIEYIVTRDYFYLSNVTTEGAPTVSYKRAPLGLGQSLGHNRGCGPY